MAGGTATRFSFNIVETLISIERDLAVKFKRSYAPNGNAFPSENVATECQGYSTRLPCYLLHFARH